VLLSTVFIHMVTEVRESLERATTMGMIPVEMEFPFAELLICMGMVYGYLVMILTFSGFIFQDFC
jgi:hypothetical protein